MTDTESTQDLSHPHQENPLKLNKTAVATVAALFAVPAAAQAEKPQNPGAQGKAKAEQQRSAAAQKQSKAKKAKTVGFTVSGVDLAGLTVTDGKLAAPITLDPTAANKHARTSLDLTATELAGEDTVTFGAADDAVKVSYEGLTATDAIQPTDTVKVIGKVVRTRTKSKGSKPAFTYGAIDIRKVVITREAPQAAPAESAPTS